MKRWAELLRFGARGVSSGQESEVADQPGDWGGRLRRLGLLLVCLAGLAIAWAYADDHYPIRDWLAWRILGYLACSLTFALAAISAGHLTLKWVVSDEVSPLEHLTLAFFVGVMEFQLFVVLGGVLHLYHWWFFYLPPLIGVPGAGSLWRYLSEQQARYRRETLGVLQWVAVGFGVLCFGLLYFNILTPDNVSFDSRAMHMGIAEDYVASHGTRPFREGWMFGAAPHFGSFLYVWAFLVPGAKLFDQMVLAQHLEFTVFAGTTLLGIPAMVKRLAPGVDPRVTWVARFLFPGVMLYDSNLSGGADHLAAMYGPAIFLAMLVAWRRLEVRYMALLGTFCAGAVMTKYTMGMMTLPFLALALMLRSFQLAVQTFKVSREARSWRWLLGLLVFGLAGLLVGTPYWLRNWINYGDPAYPMLRAWFPAHPWLPGSGEMFTQFQENGFWAPTHDWAGFKQTLLATLDFSFVPNDWPRFHGDRPVFGSLYTLFIPALLFLRGSKRSWVLVGWIQLGVFTWYWVSHQDRYLQSLVPLMAAVVAAVLGNLWRLRSPVLQVASGALVLFQVAWGGDVPFLQTHSMIQSPQKETLSLLQAGYAGKYKSRLGPRKSSFEDVGKELPRDARVVLHDQVMTLGIARPVIRDARPWQFGLNYGLLKDRPQVYDALKSLGATHVVWTDGRQRYWDSVAGEAVFYGFAQRTINQRTVAGVTIGELPKASPRTAPNTKLLLVRCSSKGYSTGIYELEDVAVLSFSSDHDELPKPRQALEFSALAAHLSGVEYVVTDEVCSGEQTEAIRKVFVLVGRTRATGKFPVYEYWSKRE